MDTFNAKEEKTPRIPSLDGLRAISIALVLLSHFMDTLHAPLPPRLLALFDVGLLGVQAFFIISGFLISNILFRELRQSSTIHLAKFYFNRTLRIFPAYYAFIIVMYFLQKFDWIMLNRNDIPRAVTYTSNYCADCSWNLGHTWSLSVEEQFYLIWPIIILFMGKRGLYVALLFVLLSPLIRSYYYYYPTSNRNLFQFESIADSIATGCLLSLMYKKIQSNWIFIKYKNSIFFLIIPVSALSIAMLTSFPSLLTPQLRLLLGMSIQNISIALCIVWSIDNHNGKIGKFLNSKLMVQFGFMSYSIYLWQQPFLNPSNTSVLGIFPLNIFLLVITTLISYYFIEKPSLKLRNILHQRLFNQDSRIHLGKNSGHHY